MKITRHTGPTSNTRCVRSVTAGANAVILATRRTANGVEITAAMDFDSDNVQDSTRWWSEVPSRPPARPVTPPAAPAAPTVPSLQPASRPATSAHHGAGAHLGVRAEPMQFSPHARRQSGRGDFPPPRSVEEPSQAPFPAPSRPPGPRPWQRDAGRTYVVPRWMRPAT